MRGQTYLFAELLHVKLPGADVVHVEDVEREVAQRGNQAYTGQ